VLIGISSLPYAVFAQGTTGGTNQPPTYTGQTLFQEEVKGERRWERNLVPWLSDDTTPPNQIEITGFQWEWAPESPNQPAGVEVVGPSAGDPFIRVKIVENQPYAIILLKFTIKDAQ
jgi:hypothetical protein